jgi:DNA polymerase-3 subunit gamma/tau
MADTTAAYQVVARRYRPQRFDELVGQEHVARGLSGAITSGRIGHAYLFTGARGVGKTSAARIFAKALECAAGPAGEPCNACDACRDIAAGQDVDVVEIDAASNRGIDEIRQLRQNVAIRPARGRFKVYIIDEVHMLTREAFNALLKTLEEPPGHVKFVLCTTEPDKLPITILSRCQRFDFTVVAPPAIARRLAAICEAEGADVTMPALELISRRAAGSMRDSQSLLEQLLGSADGAVDVDDVHALIGTGREERVAEIVTAVVARDAPAALAALGGAIEAGADPGGVIDQLVAALRDCLLASVGCGAEVLGGAGDIGIDLAEVGRRLGTATLLAMLQILDQTLSRMQSSGHPGVLAEMAIVRLARLEDLDAVADAVAALTAGVPAPAGMVGLAAGPVSRGAGVTSRVSQTPSRAPSPPASEPTREKKKPEVTIAAPGATEPADRAAAGRQRTVAPSSSAAGEAPADAPVTPDVTASAERPRAARSQAALLREVSGHPFVARAKDLFDAAIRRVDPPRPGAAPTAAQAPAASPLPAVEGEAAEREAADADDEHRNDSEER